MYSTLLYESLVTLTRGYCGDFPDGRMAHLRQCLLICRRQHVMYNRYAALLFFRADAFGLCGRARERRVPAEKAGFPENFPTTLHSIAVNLLAAGSFY